MERSSAQREYRAAEIMSENPPVDAKSLLAVLGDTEGASFAPGVHPIYR